ncbi:glycosyltransferase family 39 protein [Natrinema salaciae]|uniref:Dolichyl-phosphate-mannose-protein mannosyltransferase n=1 Tax=Natrinema salaciae TaxID=1186196 RepID=A0A1H9MV63_9EURY|nr:glycosyltransferase family 39 protein [Natrinema salaciae]SER27572.1 Dolichyl-phosphate-mannose-protein mannosyltransferase [Natrinema salaciae]
MVNSPGASRETFHTIGLTLFAAILFGTVVLQMDGLRTVDSIDYAQIARNIYRGDGFTTKEIYPLSLAFDDSLVHHPSFKRAPLFPLAVAASFVLFGVNHYAVYAISGFFYVLLVPVVYHFGKALFEKPVGLLAGIIVATSPLSIEYALSGLSEPLFTFLFTIALYLAYRRSNGALVGVALGLAYLTRYNVLLLLPGFLVFVSLHYDDWKRAMTKLAAGFSIVISPWLVRNYLLTGDPLFSLYRYELLMYTAIYPYDTLYRMFDPVDPVGFFLTYPGIMLRKAATNAMALSVDIPTLFRNFLVPALAIGGFLEFYPSKHRNLVLGIVLMIVSQLIALSFFLPHTRLFVPFAPFVVIFASAFVYRKFEQGREYGRPLLAVVLIIVLLAPNVVVLSSLSAQQPSNVVTDDDASEYAENEDLEFIREHTDEDAVIVSDAPWVVAWYADRPSVWLPAQYEEMRNRISGVEYVYVSGYYRYFDEENAFNEDVRTEYLNNPAFEEEYEPVKRFKSGGILFRKT